MHFGQGQRLALIVEDQPLVRSYLSDILDSLGFTTVAATSAREGMVTAEQVNSMELAIVDIGLPDRNGFELAVDLRRRWPELKIAIASGYAEEAVGRLRGDPNVTYLAKPFDADAVRNTLNRLGVGTESSGSCAGHRIIPSTPSDS